MNADFRLVALGVLRQYFASLTLHPDDAADYTPNKVIRRYLRDTTLLRSSDDFAAQRPPDFWLALFFGSGMGKHARSSTLYKAFVAHVIVRSGVTIADGSTCSASTYEPNQVTNWQAMALFYMCGEPLVCIQQAIPATRIQLVGHCQKLLPLNMHAFYRRTQKEMDATSYDMHLADMTLDADYAIISSVSMADISPAYLRKANAQVSRDNSEGGGDGERQQKRKQVLVASEARPSRFSNSDFGTVIGKLQTLDVVRWTGVEEQMFALDTNWTAFKMAACLSPDHPGLWTIRVYLAKLPAPPVAMSHARFVTDYMPYFDVSAVVSLPEVVEFANCLRMYDSTVNTWPAAKLVTRLIWLYDPYSIGGHATPELAKYTAKYPRLSTAFICNLVPTAKN